MTNQVGIQMSLKRWGVLLLNLGGPEDPEEIEPYLDRLFSDPNMIQLPGGWFYRRQLAHFIASRRASRVRKRYEAIGGRSPIGDETRRQAKGLSELLGIPVVHGMRYTEPAVETAMSILLDQGVERFVVLPLYPQYSRTTSLSAIQEFKRINGDAYPFVIIHSHHDNPGYIDSLAELLKATLEETQTGSSTYVLFTAHSIPKKYVRRGDPYVRQTEETVRCLRRRMKLELPSSLAFQSRIGPIRWQRPSLDEALECILSRKIEQVVVQPVSFVSENIETLHDLDIAFRRRCAESGIRRFFRVPTPRTSRSYLKALASLVVDAVERRESDHA